MVAADFHFRITCTVRHLPLLIRSEFAGRGGKLNLVEQLKAAVEVSQRVVWAVLIASITVLVVEFYYPDLFVGLPAWCLPSIRLMVVFSAVTACLPIAVWLGHKSQYLGRWFWAPIRRNKLRYELLSVDLNELYFLCRALVEGDRVTWLKADIPPTLGLLDKGLIEEYSIPVVVGDGTSSYRVPMEVWRLMIDMGEFRFSDHDQSRSVLPHGGNEHQVVLALPQGHPAVLAWKEIHQSG